MGVGGGLIVVKAQELTRSRAHNINGHLQLTQAAADVADALCVCFFSQLLHSFLRLLNHLLC